MGLLSAVQNAVCALLVLFLGYSAFNVIYNIFFHPLRRFPGPFWWRASRIPFCKELIQGTLPFTILELHEKYGDIVRLAPNELAFADSRAWKDIHGHRPNNAPEFEKWQRFYRPVPDLPTDVVNAGREEHSALRRQLSHGFSDRSMREQEPIIKTYIDKLIQRLHEKGRDGSQALDLAAWYNFTTFDVIGDLSFGEPFGCLDNSDYHPWVRAIFQMGRVGTILQTATHWPMIKNLLLKMVPEKAKRDRENHLEFTKAKLRRRLDLSDPRPDLIEGLLKKDLDLERLEANSSILIIGGSETTATLLSGATYFLLTNPEKRAKLIQEIRSAFKSEDEIDFSSVMSLPYLQACLEESLRLYPPVPNGLPRVVPRGGATVAGEFIPENTVVAIHQWAMYHNPKNFSRAFEFHPERWLGDEAFANDQKDALQPFHLGSRNCLGRNLAYNEMRVIISRLLWNFDIRIAKGSLSWLDEQKIFLFWKKGALNAYLVPVER